MGPFCAVEWSTCKAKERGGYVFSVFQWEEVLKLEEPTRVTVSSSSFLQTFSNSPLRR